MGMSISGADLLPGEQHVMTKSANMIISVKESGLSRFAFDDYMGLIGMKGKESIGGKAHLTNYRIIFKSHFFNRVRGKHSIFLPNLTHVSATLNNLILESATQHFEFVMWMKKPFINAINHQRAGCNQGGINNLKNAIISNPEAIGRGLKKCVTLEVINHICLGGRKVQSVLETLNGVERNAYVEIISLFQTEHDGL